MRYQHIAQVQTGKLEGSAIRKGSDEANVQIHIDGAWAIGSGERDPIYQLLDLHFKILVEPTPLVCESSLRGENPTALLLMRIYTLRPLLFKYVLSLTSHMRTASGTVYPLREQVKDRPSSDERIHPSNHDQRFRGRRHGEWVSKHLLHSYSLLRLAFLAALHHQYLYVLLLDLVLYLFGLALTIVTLFLCRAQSNTYPFPGETKSAWSVFQIIYCTYYLAAFILCFYIYREFKAISFEKNPAIHRYFQARNNAANETAEEPSGIALDNSIF